MTDRPRTAVIGAGISGLAAGKMINDYDVPYTTFETSDRIGEISHCCESVLCGALIDR